MGPWGLAAGATNADERILLIIITPSTSTLRSTCSASDR